MIHFCPFQEPPDISLYYKLYGTQIDNRNINYLLDQNLGEIENAVNSITDIMKTVFIAIPANDFDSKSICCAYVPKSDTTADTADTKMKLSELLPDYMIPTRWRDYDALPKIKTGK